jgi:lysophospholipid acyltransferase (LPLAT)-like uncharacterized protein
MHRKKAHTHPLATKLSAVVINLFLFLMYHLNRRSISGSDRLVRHAEQGNTIYALWHGKLFYLIYYYVKNIKTRQASILISMSRDGDYGEALATRFGHDTVRGSSSRGGRTAVRELSSRLSRGNNLMLTPDGPRGPACHANIGIIKLAQLTGACIVPGSYDAKRKLCLKSWDKFIIPLPFGRIHMAVGEPMTVPREATKEELETYRETLEISLLALDRECAARVAQQ